MRVLLVKTSSLGDVIHTLPAVTDAARAVPGIRFDWVVEEALTEIPGWHPAVDRVIPVALRRWRKTPLRSLFSTDFHTFRRALRAQRYDLIIDAQGLLKSAWIARLAEGERCGLDRDSAREPLAALSYQRTFHIPRRQHAIDRVRQLFAACLGYALPDDLPAGGLETHEFPAPPLQGRFIVCLHGTAWPSKRWPESYWRQLIGLLGAQGLQCALPWGNEEERARAQRLAADHAHAVVLPRLRLGELAALLKHATGVVAVDTGLAHLAAALAAPTVAIYGATDAVLTGTRGAGQRHLCADFACAPCLQRRCHYTGPSTVSPACYAALTPERVMQQLALDVAAA